MAFKSKQVVQYDIEGKEVTRHESMGAAARAAGVTRAGMSFYMLGKSKSPICAGFVWKYDVPEEADEIVEMEEKKILPVDPNTDEYKWDSWKEKIARRAKMNAKKLKP